MTKQSFSSTHNLPLTLESDIVPSTKDGSVYYQMFRSAPIGIVRTTLEGRLIEANYAFYQLLGYPEDFTTKRLVKDLASELYVDAASRTRLVELVLQKGTVTNYPVLFRGNRNRHVHCNLHVRAAQDRAGNISYLEAFVENVDLQSRTEQKLRESEARYRAIFETTGAGTIIIEEDTTISKVNSGFVRLFGYSKEETEYRMKWPELIADEKDRETMLRYHYLRRRKHPNVPVEYEFTLKDKTGGLRNIFLRVDIIGDTSSSVASLFDITTFKQACRHLKASESKLASLVEAFDGFIYTVTADFRLTYTNKALLRFIGNREPEVQCHKAIYQLDKPCEWCPLPQLVSGETVKTEILNHKSNRWYYMVSSHLFDDPQIAAEFQTVLIDITERKLAEEQLKEKEAILEQENIRLRATIKDRYRFGSIIGKSLPMQKIYELILRAAGSEANVIIYGESGTGKELVAREIHDLSERASGQFVAVNCSAVPEDLMESEFFGYTRGAFTGADKDKIGLFEMASGGTLFLDELGEISEKLQVKLLRALEGGGYTPVGSTQRRISNVRIIAATNRNLGELIDKGLMREDFFYRIHILPVELPPLRKRKEDIPLLIEHFMKKYKSNQPIGPLSGQSIERLMQHDWPGNVRELENTMQRYINLRYLDISDRRNRPQTVHHQNPDVRPQPLGQAVQDFERDFIMKILSENRWNRTRVAQLLGIERKTLYLKLKKLGIDSARS